ncbi:hypothetical protein BDB00DRAFT_771675 [Zychaea mexicana]|uniref:uncharacterized protein n=1 Tax=Zychaea mexicana TaxID=64656 RepID=UPI0022FF0819|nr:uncharacterized protein BDB00DRAFT_771675 [Zychaea mexicana]KAI9488921.1 hypothetical protein BDB00DRAFT_771675 [Zychaea mexicana]
MPPAPPPSPPPSALPKDNDWPRADRMIVRQELIKLALDGLFCSPLDLADSSKERNILHIGCGNGSWSMDMATKYKHCWVLGIDDRDVLDSSRATPRNFRFLKSSHGILHHLQTLPDNHFDFIYGRFLIFSYNPDHYREIVQECWRLCRSGGYVEMMELDMRIYGSPVVGPMTHMLNSQGKDSAHKF